MTTFVLDSSLAVADKREQWHRVRTVQTLCGGHIQMSIKGEEEFFRMQIVFFEF